MNVLGPSLLRPCIFALAHFCENRNERESFWFCFLWKLAYPRNGAKASLASRAKWSDKPTGRPLALYARPGYVLRASMKASRSMSSTRHASQGGQLAASLSRADSGYLRLTT